MQKSIAALSAFAWLAAALGGMVIVFVCLYVANRGFDITDETFYLFWALNPESYLYVATMFGHVLSPLLDLVHGDIAAFRRAGIVMLVAVAASCWFAWRGNDASRSPATDVMAAATVGALSLLYFGNLWILTPSYNWLGTIAGFFLFAALGLRARNAAWSVAALLAALAGLCAVAARPPAGLALGLIYFAAVLLAARSMRDGIRDLVAAGVAIVLLAAFSLLFVFDGNAIWRQYSNYMSIRAQWSGGLGGVQLIQFGVFRDTPGGLPLLLAGFGLIGMMLVLRRMHSATARHGSLLLVAAYFVTGVTLTHGLYPRAAGHMMLLTCCAFTVLALGLALDRGASARRYLILALALLIPFGSTLGTGNGLAQSAFQGAGISAAVLIIATAAAFGRQTASVPALCLTAGLAYILNASAAAPYRLPAAIGSQSTPVEIPYHGNLLVDARTHEMLSGLRQAAVVHGFPGKTPVLDFTGQAPGLVLAIGGTAPVRPWIIGGASWSNDQLIAVLANIPEEELRAAWILWGDNPRAFDPEFLAGLGFALETDYALAGEVPHASQGWNVGLYYPLPEPER